jgi:lipid A 3-O-deacylase
VSALTKTVFFLFVVIVVNLPCSAWAADDVSNVTHTPTPEVYTEDRISLQLVSGAIFSPTIFASRTPVMDYAQTNLRLGWMINGPGRVGFLPRGNLEAILELTNSIIYKGPGNYMGGLTALIRYNIVPKDSRFVPYVQVGAGVVYTDAYKDRTQNAIGNSVEFTPQGSIGCHYMINKNWSISAEVIFHHISNAGVDHRNRGINAFGGFLGLTYYFDWLWI